MVFTGDCAAATRRFCVLGAEAQRMRGYGYTSNALTVLAVQLVVATLARSKAAGWAADTEVPVSTSTIGAIGQCWIGALAAVRVAPVFGTSVEVIALRVVIAAATPIANTISALAVAAVFVGRADRLFAYTVETDAGNAVLVTGFAKRGVRSELALTSATTAVVIGALVAVVALFVPGAPRRPDNAGTA